MYFGNEFSYNECRFIFTKFLVLNFKIIFVFVGISFLIISCSNKSDFLYSSKKAINLIELKMLLHHTNQLSKSIQPAENCDTCIKIFISKDNQYYIGDENSLLINKEELEVEILKNIGKDSTVELLGDKDSQLDHTIFVLDIVKKHGLKVIIKTNK